MIYLRYLKMQLRSVVEYRLSAWLMMLGQFVMGASMFVGVALLFQRFSNLDGWSFSEVALCFGVTYISFSVTECTARGFDTFSGSIVRGDFDRVLLRPRSTLVQVLGSGFEFTRLGKALQGLLVLAYAVTQAEILWTADKVLTLVLMIMGGICVFSGVFILGATVCFFTVEGLEFINVFTDGGREMASYPMTIYARWFRNFFTFVIPYGCMNYLPLLYLTGRSSEPLYMLLPLAGPLFLLPCVLIWNWGVRKYASTGS